MARFIRKVLSTCTSCEPCGNPSGVPAPRDEPEVPIALRNPYKSTFLERVLVKYQEPPTGHPYNPCEHGFTPDTLSALEQMRLMTDCEKKANIKKRDYRWFDGTRAAPKEVEAGVSKGMAKKMRQLADMLANDDSSDDAEIVEQAVAALGLDKMKTSKAVKALRDKFLTGKLGYDEAEAVRALTPFFDTSEAEAANNIVTLPYLTNVAPDKRLDRAVEVYFKKTGKDEKGVEKLIRDYNKKDPEYFKAIMKKHGLKSIKQLVQHILR